MKEKEMQPNEPTQAPSFPENQPLGDSSTTPISIAPQNNPNEKRIKNSSRTALIFGIFVIVLVLLMAPAYGGTHNVIASVVAGVFYGLSGVAFIIYSRKLKQAVDGMRAKKLLGALAVVSGIILTTGVINGIAQGKGFLGWFGVISLVALAYFIFVRSRIQVTA